MLDIIQQNPGYAIIAIGTILASIIGPVVAWLLADTSKTKTPYIKLNNKERLGRVWQGNIIEYPENRKNPVSSNLKMELTVKGKKVSGLLEIHYTATREESASLQKYWLEGGFVDDSYIQLKYANQDSKQKQYGSIYLRLCDTAKSLEGKFLGYGPISRKLVEGKIKMALQT